MCKKTELYYLKCDIRDTTNTKDLELLRYGITGFFKTLIILLLVFSISVCIDNFNPTLLFTVSYMLLRSFSGGFHFHSSIICFVISIVFLVGSPYFIIYIYNDIIIYTVLSAFCIYVIRYTNTVDNSKKRLSFSEKKQFKKIYNNCLKFLCVLQILFGVLMNQTAVMIIQGSVICNSALIVLSKMVD